MGTFFDFARELPPWVVLALGVIAGGLRSMWAFLYQHTIGYAITRVTISLSVEDMENPDAYMWLSCWVERSLRGRRVNSLLLRAQRHQEDSEEDAPPRFQMIPEYGTYYLLYQRRLMTVSHWKSSSPEMLGSRAMRPMRSIRLQIWLCWNRDILLRILEEAQAAHRTGEDRRVEIFQADSYGDWSSSRIGPRPLETVFHPPELMEDLLEDVGSFLRSKPLYEELGIPYRRGYLLEGPPGTGKSSLILAIASQFRLPVYLVPLRGAEMSGERLARMLAYCRKPALVVLEDVDCLKVATTRDSNVADGLTMADLLNAVDGIGANEHRLLFMTANRPEALDAALIRAGRVDRRFHIGYARDEELFRFYERLARTQAVPPWPEFRAALPASATIADAQALARISHQPSAATRGLAFQGSRPARRPVEQRGRFPALGTARARHPVA